MKIIFFSNKFTCFHFQFSVYKSSNFLTIKFGAHAKLMRTNEEKSWSENMNCTYWACKNGHDFRLILNAYKNILKNKTKQKIYFDFHTLPYYFILNSSIFEYTLC